MQERAQLDRVRKMIYDQILQWTHVLLLTAKFTCITLGVALIDYMQESSMLSIEMRRLTFFFFFADFFNVSAHEKPSARLRSKAAILK